MWLLWSVALGFWIALAVIPVSYRITRISSIALSAVVWFGLVALVWRQRPLRFALLGITSLSVLFLLLPGRGRPSVDALRLDYVARLQRFDGVTYHWGGETGFGIDCSGLVRRGFIEALFRRGLQRLDPGLVRRAIGLWWHDCTASALGEEHRGVTRHVLDTPSLNSLDHALVRPGDLAVTRNGVHVMAYLGEHRWIEADPGAGRVITVMAPSADNPWFKDPMKIVRWSLLQ